MNEVTRFEVIDETGRAYVRYDISAEWDFQDDDRTLKVFIKPRQLRFTRTYRILSDKK